MAKFPILWLRDDQALHARCQHWQTLPAISVDTEFKRTNTYYPIPALVQISDGQASYLIDPLSIDDFQPLRALFADGSVQKILHSCSEDLEVFMRLLGTLPVNLFDTQIAAAFCGYGFSVGYANLVEVALGVTLPKDETRSDWLQRPLTETQETYAALDVEFLFLLAQHLNEQLQAQGKYDWVQQDCATVLRNYADSQSVGDAVKRFKAAWRLSPRELQVLDELAQWRERVAQQRDLPRNFVVKNPALFELAQRRPNHPGQLRRFEGLSDGTVRRFGRDIISVIQSALAVADSELPEPLPRPLSADENRQLKFLRNVIDEVAARHGIAPEILARKKDLESIIRALNTAEPEAAKSLCAATFEGWRDGVMGDALRQAIQELSNGE